MYDIPILMLHTVNDKPKQNPLGVLSVSSKGLDAYLKVFKRWHYQMISMDDLIKRNYDEEKPFVVLTFDDGYKDNLTVALPILRKYGAHATVFLNPDYMSLETDKTSDWGFMTMEEAKAAAASGVFDLQAHTMTHEFVFISDKVVDYYTPEKFNKYYWLAWMLFPDSPRAWNACAMSYKEKIPTGYPVFEYGRRLSSPCFVPNEDYVAHLIEQYRHGCGVEYVGSHGKYETHEEYLEYARWEVAHCKSFLEEHFGNDVHTLCFPGGGYTDEVLSIAKACGYRCFMNASKLRNGNNNEHLARLYEGEFVGLNRTSFSLIHPGLFPDSFYDYWIAKLSLATYQNKQPYVFFKKFFASLLRK